MNKKNIRNCLLFVSHAIAVAAGIQVSAQTPSTLLAFEAATVKPTDPSVRPGADPKHCFWVHVSATRATYCSMPINALISYAYDLDWFQVALPESASHQDYDIEATFPEGADKKDDKKMLQTLLKERFQIDLPHRGKTIGDLCHSCRETRAEIDALPSRPTSS